MTLKNSLRVYFLPFMVFLIGIFTYYAFFMRSVERSLYDLPLLVRDFYVANFTHQATESLNNSQTGKIDKAQVLITAYPTSNMQAPSTQEYSSNSQNSQSLLESLESTQDQEDKRATTSPNIPNKNIHTQDNLTDDLIISQTTPQPSQDAITPNESIDSILDSMPQTIFTQDGILSPQESLESRASNLGVQTFYIIAKNANVRESRNMNAPIIKRLQFGQAVLVESIQDGWAELDSGGFISSDLLSSTQPIKIFYVAVPMLNVREMPSMDAKIIGALKLNDEIIIKSISNGWAELDSGGFISFNLTKENL